MRTRTFRATALSVLACFSLVAAACGDDDDDDDAGGADATTAEGTTAPEGTTAAEGTTAEGTTAGTEPEGTSAPTAPARGDADLVIWTDDTRQPVVEEIATTFAEENGITVAVQELEFGQIREQLSLAAPAGDGPDIVIGAHDWLGELVTNGVLEPLDISGVAAGFDPVSVAAFTYDGQTYGLPYAVENIALVRNTDLVPEAPATFEDMVQAATDFKAQYPDDPTYQGLALQVGPEGDGYHYQPDPHRVRRLHLRPEPRRHVQPRRPRARLARRHRGGDVPVRAGGRRAAQRRHELRRDDRELRRPARRPSPSPVRGRSARRTTASPRPACRTRSPRSLPARTARCRRSFVGAQGFMISSFSEQKDLAKSFVLDFMSQESTQLALFEAGGRPPALLSAREQVSSDPDIAGFGASGEAGIPLPAIPEMSNVWTSLGLAEVNVLRGADPSEEFTAAAESIRAEIGG